MVTRICDNPNCQSEAVDTCEECGRHFCAGHMRHPDHVEPS